VSSTNYRNTFITVSPDSTAVTGIVPSRPGTVADRQFALIRDQPYAFTSDELLFTVHAQKHEIADGDLDKARSAFFAKSQACLRASPLVKQYGWGVHHDENERIALVPVNSEKYQRLSTDPAVTVVAGMRSKRA
jgi:hypothetical protein